MKILIAEDDRPSRLVLSTVLKPLGHEVVLTTNGEEAWERIQQCYFPVIISDWMMPGWDGLTLCRAVRSRRSEQYTIVLLLTAMSGKANYLQAMEAGADDFLTKPLDKDQLAARLRVAERILGLHQQVRRLEGLLPICSYCKRIRDEQNSWNDVEQYVAQRSQASFTHGICPDCTKAVLGRLT